jgi:PD-(D/E)XK nuclease superfamily
MSSLQEFLGTERVERPWPEKIHHLSQSSIGMLFRCPRQFERRYLHGEKERPGESIVIGSFFHEANQHNYEQKVTTFQDLPLSEIVTYLHDAAIPKVLEEEGGVDNIRWDSGLDTARSDAERITAAYVKQVVPRIQPVGVEHKFEIDMEGVPVPIIGYIDVWEAERNLDTKTGKQAVMKVKPSWGLQGRLYGWATGRPTEYHSISRAKTPKINTALESEFLTVPVPSDVQRHNMEHIFRTAADQISYYYSRFGEEGWPTFGAVPDFTRNMLPCDFCGWRQGCPAWA